MTCIDNEGVESNDLESNHLYTYTPTQKHTILHILKTTTAE